MLPFIIGFVVTLVMKWLIMGLPRPPREWYPRLLHLQDLRHWVGEAKLKLTEIEIAFITGVTHRNRFSYWRVTHRNAQK